MPASVSRGRGHPPVAVVFRLVLLAAALHPCVAFGEQELVLADEGESLAPIIVFRGAPPATRRAADELATYIEKISGAQPRVIEGEPKPVPPHAIWVGYQPAVERLFPDVSFEFTKPEEIVIAATKDHLVIAGRDRWDPAHREATTASGRDQGSWGDHDGQQEYGTANAVSTFLQDHLGVRWLWPGEGGTDIVRRPPAKTAGRGIPLGRKRGCSSGTVAPSTTRRFPTGRCGWPMPWAARSPSGIQAGTTG